MLIKDGLTQEVFTIAIDVRGIPEELAICVELVEDGVTFVVGLWLAVESTLL